MTSSSATITWTSTQPATSQVEFGPSIAYGFTSGVDATQTIEHRQLLSGLQPGTVYHYRVTSIDALGTRVTSPDAFFATPLRGVRGAVDDVLARRITSTTATLSWSAPTSIAQVDYGVSPGYGLFTLLRTYATANQDITLSNLLPETLYHYRVKTWNSAGAMAVSPDFTFTTAPAHPAVLLGNATIDDRHTTIPPGQAYVFQYSATASGLGNWLRLYIDAGTTSQSAMVGVYADEAGRPGVLLGQGGIQQLTPSAWNRAPLDGVPLARGSTYWIGVLNAAGVLNVRGASGSGTSQSAAQTLLNTLPFNWLSAPIGGGTTTLSVAVQQITPSAALIEPSDGRSVSGNVTLTATADDEVPIVSVQFLVDDVPVGPPAGAAPFTTVWDSRRSTTHDFHRVSARVTDALGRVAFASPAWVPVDNGAAISQVAVSQVTATSAWVSWSTDSFSDSQVEFGLTAAYGQMAPQDNAMTWQHHQLLTGLAPGTTYHFRVRSRDLRGAVGGSADDTFTTRSAVP